MTYHLFSLSTHLIKGQVKAYAKLNLTHSGFDLRCDITIKHQLFPYPQEFSVYSNVFIYIDAFDMHLKIFYLVKYIYIYTHI